MSTHTEQLARWLAVHQPAVFAALARRAQAQRLSGAVTDFFVNIGGAVKNVGNYLSSEDGMKTLSSLGTLYVQSRTQREALRLQAATVQAGYAPLPVETAGSNAYYAPTGQLVTPSLATQLAPRKSFWQEYSPAIAFAAAFAFLYAARR